MREGNINRPRNLSDLVIEKYTVDSQLMILLNPGSEPLLSEKLFYISPYLTAGSNYSGPAAKTAPY